MTNHVLLIIDPGDHAESLGLLIKRIAGRQTRYVNRLENRSGSLWEGRYKSSPINANEYLLACCRYIELNPLRAGMVEKTWQYPWSICPIKIGIKQQSWLDLDPFYLSLCKTRKVRGDTYKKWLMETIPKNWAAVLSYAGREDPGKEKNKFVLFFPIHNSSIELGFMDWREDVSFSRDEFELRLPPGFSRVIVP
ncbi:MAG: hypothetical protein U9R66_04340 [Thermodesulfobacteriota bacterium]|nr:hypothetical protein [Thermodesulfobacteriota bacterium]